MTTDKTETKGFIKDMGAIFTPVFYIFAIVAIASAVIVQGFKAETILSAIFLVFLAAAAAADIGEGIVPDMLCLLIAACGVLKIIFTGDLSSGTLFLHIAGSLCISVPMLICALFVKGGFGGGDIKLMAAAGLYLALDKTLIASLIAFLLAGIYSITILMRHGSKNTKIRLAPFLATGLGFAALFGDDLLLAARLFSQVR